MRKSFSYLSILIELSKGRKMSGYDIIVHMNKYGFEVSPGTIYDQLDKLAKGGTIRAKRAKTKIYLKHKTIYEITKEGKELYKEFKKKWNRSMEYAYKNLLEP